MVVAVCSAAQRRGTPWAKRYFLTPVKSSKYVFVYAEKSKGFEADCGNYYSSMAVEQKYSINLSNNKKETSWFEELGIGAGA